MGLGSSIEVGSVAELVSGVGALAAAVVALWVVFRQERHATRSSAAQVWVQRIAQYGDVDGKPCPRDQAVCVAVWHLIVHNGANGPIHDLRATLTFPDGRKLESSGSEPEFAALGIGRSDGVFMTDGVSSPVDVPVLEFTFRTNDGIRWHTVDGQPPTRVKS
ncbi:MAG: hypothetical protein U0Q03_11330 [Acidimicrobiales bacterium]